MLVRRGRFYGIREYLDQLRPTRVQQQRDYHAPSLPPSLPLFYIPSPILYVSFPFLLLLFSRFQHLKFHAVTPKPNKNRSGEWR